MKFEGEAWVSGTLFARWTQTNKPTIEVTLIPEKNSDLPQYGFSEFKPYTFDVQIENGKTLLQSAFGRDIATKLSRKQIRQAQVRGRFLMTNYKMGVACDSGWASANLSQVEVRRDTIAQKAPRLQGSC